MLSLNSLTAQLGGALGLIGLTTLAAATTTVTAILVGGAVLAAAAPLYLLTRPQTPSPAQVVARSR